MKNVWYSFSKLTACLLESVISMRVVKEAEERKNEILDAAEELFVTKGYDGTSTGDILEKTFCSGQDSILHIETKTEICDRQ